jgi:hypothetical protein
MRRTILVANVVTLISVLWLASSYHLAADPPTTTIPPACVTLASDDNATLADVLMAIEKQTGLKVNPGPADLSQPIQLRNVADRPFWEVLDELAAATNTRAVVGQQGREIGLGPPTGMRPIVSSDGPFRIVAKTMAARTDLDSGRTSYDLVLDIHWEPRFPVFRIDSQPRITAGQDDLGQALSSTAVSVKSQVTGFSHTTAVRLEGLTRRSGSIAVLAGAFQVTASPRMLSVRFDNLAATPVERRVEGVTVRLVRFARVDDRWEAEFDLTYPPGQPEFESFETWATGNTLRLVAPGAGRVFTPDNFDLIESSQRVRATYRFQIGERKGLTITDIQGWQLIYDTPAPLVEFPVRFELKDIPLP